MRRTTKIAAASLAACLLAGCQPGALGMLEPVQVSAQKEAPPGAPENTCWDRDDSPAVIETVTEQVELERSQTDESGQVTKPAVYQTETNHRIVKAREEAWFQTPCPEQMTPEFIASLQRALNARGHYRGSDHGRLDRWTRAGIRAYQKPQGLDSATLSLAAAQQMGLAIVELPGRVPAPEPEVAQDMANTPLDAAQPEAAPSQADIAARETEAQRTVKAAREAEAARIAEAQHKADEKIRAELAQKQALYQQTEAKRLAEAARKAEAARIAAAQRLEDEKARAELAEQAALYRQAEAQRQAEEARLAEEARQAALAAEAAAARQAEAQRQTAARAAEERAAQTARDDAARKAKAAQAAQTQSATQSQQARRDAELRRALEDEQRRIQSTGRQTLPISSESY